MNYKLSESFKNILITGGAGFIGSNLILKLIGDKDLNIFNLDKISYCSDKDLNNSLLINKNINYEFLKIDLVNQIEIENAIEFIKPDLVINLAAESHVDRSIKNPRSFLESNVIGTFNLLNASKNYWDKLNLDKKEKFKFLQISTDEVFGSLSKTGKFSEESPYKPSSPYSASKASSDHFVAAWFKTYNFPSIITNCTNNYGPRQYPEKLLPLCIKRILSNSKIPIYGDGKNIRDWIYIDDHLDSIILVALKGKPGKSYCIGGNQEISNIEIVKLICKKLDKKINRKNSSIALIDFVLDRDGHDYRYSIDSNYIKNELNWEPKINLHDGLDKTINWYLKNIGWIYKF